MQPISKYYYYRYENSKGLQVFLLDSRIHWGCMNSKVTILLNTGRVVVWNRYGSGSDKSSRVVKAHNVLASDRPIDFAVLKPFLQSFSWQTDLQTIDINDYPELFI